jgi:hypothetical protein
MEMIRQRSRFSALLLLTLSILLTALAPPGDLAHPIVTGALGPWSHVRVVLHYEDIQNQSGFRGIVESPVGALPVPPPDEPSDFFDVKVSAVMFARTGRAHGRALVILYRARKLGPGNAPYDAADVIVWTGKALTRVRPVEVLLDGASDAAEVRLRLARGHRG